MVRIYTSLVAAFVFAIAVRASPVPSLRESQDVLDFAARDVMEATSNLPRYFATDSFEERTFSDSSSDELIAREFEQDLDVRDPSFKSFFRKIGRIAKKALHVVMRRDLEESSSNLPRDLHKEFNFERDYDEVVGRDSEDDLETRDPSFKSFFHKIGRLAKKALHVVMRRDLDSELDAREYEDSPYDSRDFEDEARSFEDLDELVKRFAEEAETDLFLRDLTFDMIDELD